MSQLYNSSSYDDTLSIAQAICNDFHGGEILLLDGDLGAGKTAFSRGIGLALGIKEPITSPSFSIMNFYPSEPLSLCHCDFYRIESDDDYLNLGLEDFFIEENILLFEWGSKFAHLIPKPYFIITIQILEEDQRGIKIEKIT